MTRFHDEAELSEWWELSGEPWFAVRDAATDIYILSCNEDGDVFWTTMPNEEGDDPTGWLRDWKATYPLDLLEYVPEDTQMTADTDPALQSPEAKETIAFLRENAEALGLGGTSSGKGDAA